MKWWQLRRGKRTSNGSCVPIWNWKKKSNENSGVSPEEARYAARRAFGNATVIKEQTHEAWGWAPFERLGQDLRYAFRRTAQVARIYCCRPGHFNSGHWGHNSNFHNRLCHASAEVAHISSPTALSASMMCVCKALSTGGL